MIEQSTIDKIFATANIVEVVGDFVSLKRNGVNYKACCPFHNEKTPSFVVSPVKGLYKCFGCSKGGNAVSFVMEHENMSYVDALKYLARKYHIEIVEHDLTPEQKEKNDDRESMMVTNSYAHDFFKRELSSGSEGRAVGLSYFRERGFTDAIIDKFSLGFCPSSGDAFSSAALTEGYKEDFLIRTGLTIKKETGGYYDRFCGRVMFPVYSLSGRVIAFGGRTLRTDKKVAKYLNSPESEIYHKGSSLYGLFQAKKSIVENNYCILVEGYTDVLSMFQSGVENVVASSGTALTVDQIKLIARFTKNVTVIYDGDSAGIKASMRGIDMILAEGLNVRVVLLPEGEDPDSFARGRSSSELADYILNSEVDFITFKTNLLLNEVKGDPIGRASIITDIVNSISVIPDEIVRYQFVKESSRLLEVDDDLIAREVARRVNDALHGTAGHEVFQNRQRKEAFIQKKEAENKRQQLVEINQADSVSSLEKELVEYLLKYGSRNFYFPQRGEDGKPIDPIELNVAETIINEMQVDSIEFANPIYKTLYDAYVSEMERISAINEKSVNGELSVITPHNFINNPSKEVCNFVVDLLTSDDNYRPSRIWAKFDDVIISESDNLDVAVPKAIAVYKLHIISDIKKELLAELLVVSEEEAMDILRKIGSLDETRKIICEKYSRML